MKVLFSDYDGTIKTFDKRPNIIEKYTFKKNLLYIRKFIASGNIFNITTGRSPESIRREIEKYSILYNYLTCYDGKITFDNKGKILSSSFIDEDILVGIRKLLLDKDLITKVVSYNKDGRVNSLDNSIVLYLFFNNFSEVKKYIDNIVSDKKDIVVEYSSFLKRVSITSKINKETAANKLIDFNDWNYSDIYSVGDGKNDLELLTAYNGYKMLLSDPRLYYYIDDTTTSLHKLIKKIN